MRQNIFHYLSIQRRTLTSHIMNNSLKGKVTAVYEGGLLLDIGNGNTVNVPVDSRKMQSLSLEPGKEAMILIRAAEVVANA